MRILVVNWQDIKNPLAGGAEVHLHEVFSRVAKMGHEVVLFCSSFRGALPGYYRDPCPGQVMVRRTDLRPLIGNL